MAYITALEVKEIRENIKSVFPKTFKFSITKEHCSVVHVNLMKSKLDFGGVDYAQHPKKHKTIFKILKAIVNKNNFDHSDSMTDYFHVGFYSRITLGQYSKPYVQI